MAVRTGLQDLSDDIEYCNLAHDLFCEKSRRLEKIIGWVDDSLPAFIKSIGTPIGTNDGDRKAVKLRLRVLSVGPGNGLIDLKMLHHIREVVKPQGGIQAVIVEPDHRLMQEYKELASSNSSNLQDVDFEWRFQTLEEYQKMSKDEEKFDFISSVGSIYYVKDLARSLRYLYEKLAHDGLLVLTIISGDSGFGQVWKYLQRVLPTSLDVTEACSKEKVPVADIQTIKIRCDISCIDPPEKMPRDANVLLDFLTHTIDFSENADEDHKNVLLSFIKGDACSERGPNGELNLNVDNAAIVINKHVSSSVA